jgi:hypothetical protein
MQNLCRTGFLAKSIAFAGEQKLQGLNEETDYLDSNNLLESYTHLLECGIRYFLGIVNHTASAKCECRQVNNIVVAAKTPPFPDQLLLSLFDCCLLPLKTPVDFKYRMTMTTPATAQKKRSQNVQQMKARRERFAFSRSSQDSLLML